MPPPRLRPRFGFTAGLSRKKNAGQPRRGGGGLEAERRQARESARSEDEQGDKIGEGEATGTRRVGRDRSGEVRGGSAWSMRSGRGWGFVVLVETRVSGAVLAVIPVAGALSRSRSRCPAGSVWNSVSARASRSHPCAGGLVQAAPRTGDRKLRCLRM